MMMNHRSKVQTYDEMGPVTTYKVREFVIIKIKIIALFSMSSITFTIVRYSIQDTQDYENEVEFWI